MKNIILAATLALSLPGCATITDNPTAPLTQTHIDEQALTAAYASFDVLLTAIDGLVVAGAIVPGTPRALAIQGHIKDAQTALNTVREFRTGLSGGNPTESLAVATRAFRAITVLLKGN